MAKEIKKQEVMEEEMEKEVEATVEENAEETTAEKPKKEGFLKKHKKAIIAGAAALVVGGIGAVVKYIYDKNDVTSDGDSDDLNDSANEVEE